MTIDSDIVRAYELPERVRTYDADMDIMHPLRWKMFEIGLEILPYDETQALDVLDLGVGTGVLVGFGLGVGIGVAVGLGVNVGNINGVEVGVAVCTAVGAGPMVGIGDLVGAIAVVTGSSVAAIVGGGVVEVIGSVAGSKVPGILRIIVGICAAVEGMVGSRVFERAFAAFFDGIFVDSMVD